MSRLIDADKIQYETMLSARGNGQYEEVMIAYKDQIDNLPKVEPKQSWIPCRDRPPEEGTEVLVYLLKNTVPYIAWRDDGRWYTEVCEVDVKDEPIAWMPLPEAWEGEAPE